MVWGADNECSSIPLSYNEGCGLRSHWAPLQQKHQRPFRLGTVTCCVFTVCPDTSSHGSVAAAYLWGHLCFLYACGIWRAASDRGSMLGEDTSSEEKLSLHINRPACVCNLNHPFPLRTPLSLFSVSVATHSSFLHLVRLCSWRQTLWGFGYWKTANICTVS